MRKTSMILGVIGSILALILGGFAVYDAIYISFWDDLFSYDYEYDYYYDDYQDYNSLAAPVTDELLPRPEDIPDDRLEPYPDAYGITSGCSVMLGGLLGIIGSLLVRRRNTAGGVLFIVAAVLTVFSTAFIAAVLFVIASVFALKSEHPAAPVMVVPLSGYYPAYTPYGAYPPSSPPPAPSAPPAYPPYGAYPPPSAPFVPPAPAEHAAPAYPPNGAYLPPWPYGYAWPPAPAADSPQPPKPADPPPQPQD